MVNIMTNPIKTQYKSNNNDSSNSCYNCGTIHAHYNKACPAYSKHATNVITVIITAKCVVLQKQTSTSK